MAMTGTALALLLSGCATLPTNGPTAGQVERSARKSETTLNFRIIDIDARLAMPQPAASALGLLQLEALSAINVQERADQIHPGDELTITVFEVGVSLFASPPPSPGGMDMPVANAQRIAVQVKEDGTIDMPYLGRFRAAGSFPDALAAQIKGRLQVYSESPQVMIATTESVANTAYVQGAVGRSGRYRLSSAHERLLDIVALAGGPTLDPSDAELRITRGDKSASIGLAELGQNDVANLMVQPGDRIEIRKRTKTYTVFGAADRIAQIPFDSSSLSLAEAVARAGGPSDARANPRGIFLFRFERSEGADAARPVIYRLNMLKTESYFLAQLFPMRDKDVLLFANSDANLPTKLVSIVNQLASPFVTARVLTQ